MLASHFPGYKYPFVFLFFTKRLIAVDSVAILVLQVMVKVGSVPVAEFNEVPKFRPPLLSKKRRQGFNVKTMENSPTYTVKGSRQYLCLFRKNY